MTMKIERELMRGAGPVVVLKLLETGERYGYELVEALSKQSDGILAMGQSTLYPMLYNLEAKGYIKSEWQKQTNGRKRKYYTLTGKGKGRLASDTKQWLAITKAMRAMGVIGGDGSAELGSTSALIPGKVVPS